MLPPGSSLVRIAGGPASARARPVLRQPAVDRPGNPRLLLRDVDASLCQSLLRHRGQRHVGLRVERANRRRCRRIDVSRTRHRVAVAGTPTDTSNGRSKGANDTFAAGQRHVRRGQRHPSPGQAPGACGRALAGAEAKALTPARWPSWHRSATGGGNSPMECSSRAFGPRCSLQARPVDDAGGVPPHSGGAYGQPCRGPVGHGR